MQLYMHVYGRKGTWRPTIPVQRSKQLCYRLQLSSFNREFMYIYCTTVMQCKQGSNFIAAIAAIAVEGEQNAVDHCGNDGNFLPYGAIFILFTVQLHWYLNSDVDQIMRKSLF
jgi:hypothetical protein